MAQTEQQRYESIAKYIAEYSSFTVDDIPPYSTYVEHCNKNKGKKKPAEIDVDNGFQELWDTYPSSANYSYKGMKFSSSRVLRANRQVCEMLYLKGIAQNKITGEQILKGLQKQKNLALEESYNTGQNKLEYWPSLEVWLRQERYLAMIEIESDDSYIEENYSA